MLKKLFFLFLMIWGFSACDDAKDIDLQKDLVVGVSADYPPFEFMRGGEIIGFDISLARAIGEVLGKKVIIREVEFPSLMPALKSGKINMAISGLSRTKDRQMQFAFSDIYYHNLFALLQKKDGEIKDISDFSGKAIGAQTGSTMYHLLKDLQSQGKEVDVLALNNNNVLVEELKLGRIDGVLMELANAKAYVRANSGLRYTKIQHAAMGYAIMMNKDDPLIPEVNRALGILRSNGTLTKLQKEWIEEHD